MLSHGHLYLQYALDVQVPLGVLSESAIEARNIDNKQVRKMHARKYGFEEQNLDCFNWMNWTSDPIVNSKKREVKPKPRRRSIG